MAEFIGVHKLLPDMKAEDVEAGYQSYKEAATKMGLKSMRAHYSMEKGVAYCETEAPSAEEVRKAHEGAAIPLEDVIEVKTIE